ncbi:Family of unknown function (DUF648) [Chlamydia poikilotherma]|uniref:Uncharacterized protein n=1 Tax=Chlamydia poikilotherma TaxID=1967783 RepID=A0A3B0PS89_9CHLA|nr:DUF648 domain-containing protein [Chlamydia poikilotherma]SYX09038.1 Family of unknown function (DUF648) [Chlamydia poikilotherma]
MLNSVTFSPIYSPNRAEKFSALLDSYFYLGGKQTKVIDKSTELGLRFAVQHEGRAISTVQKILKILSWIFVPIVILAWLLRQALHLYLHIAYPCVYLDTPLSESLQKEIITTCQKISYFLNFKTILTREDEAYQELDAEGITIAKPKEEFANALPERFYLDSHKSHTFYILGNRDQFNTQYLDLYNLVHSGRNLISEFELTGNNDKKSIEKCLKDSLGITAKISRLPKQIQGIHGGLKAEFRFDSYPDYVCLLNDNSISINEITNSSQVESKEIAVARFVRNVLESRHIEKKGDSSYISWPKYIGCDMSSGIVVLDDEEEHKQLIITNPQGETTANLKLFTSQSFIECYQSMKSKHIVPYILGEQAAFKHHQNRHQLIMNESGSRLPMDSYENRKNVMSAFLRQVPSAFLGDVLNNATFEEVGAALESLDREKIARSLNLSPVTIPRAYLLQKRPELRALSDKQIKLQLAIEFITEILSPTDPNTVEIFIPHKEQNTAVSGSSTTFWGNLSDPIRIGLTNSILIQLEKMHIIEGYTEVSRGVYIRLNSIKTDS